MIRQWATRWMSRRSLPLMLAGGVCLTGAGFDASLSAADPVVIVSIKSLDELMADSGWLGERIGFPLPQVLQGGLGALTQGQELTGLDTERPIGAMLLLDENGQPSEPLVFLPVSDGAAFSKTLAGILNKQGEKDGVTSFAAPNGMPLFGTLEGDWYYLVNSSKPDALSDLPDPALALKSKSDIAIDVDFDKLPKAMRDQALAAMEATSQAQLDNAKDENERAGIEFGQQVARSMVTDISRFTIALDIDAEDGVLAFDLGVTGRRGTPMARALDAYGQIKSTFASLDTDDTVASFVFAAPLSEQVQTALIAAMRAGFNEGIAENNPSEEELKAANQILDVMIRTIQQPSMDSGFVVNNIDGQLQVIAAASVADGDKLSELLTKAVGRDKSKELKLNAAMHEGVAIHEVAMSGLDAKSEELLGSGPANFALAPKRVVMAMGAEPLDGVKQALDAEAPAKAERTPISLHVGVGASLELARNDDNAGAIDGALEALGELPDFVVVELAPHPRGASFRIELEEGVLKLIGFAIQTHMSGQ